MLQFTVAGILTRARARARAGRAKLLFLPLNVPIFDILFAVAVVVAKAP